MWDSSLDLFRPIDGFAWNGTQWEIEDTVYRKDPFDKTYSFGSAELLAHCIQLSKTYAGKIETAPTASYLAIGTPIWFRDRPVTFTSCSPRDLASWKRCVNGHARTCKQRSNKRFTKRNLK